MVGRCHNPNWNNYYTKTYYKDKGIIVCDEWRTDFQTFKKWAIENGYSNILSIDRIDPDGNYEPSNCRWITIEENRNLARKKPYKQHRRNNNIKRIGNYEVRFSSVYGLCRVVKSGLMYREAKRLSDELSEKERGKIPCGYFYSVAKTVK